MRLAPPPRCSRVFILCAKDRRVKHTWKGIAFRAELTNYNQVEIDTPGNNFRRFVDVGGSADGASWSTLASAAIIFRFAAGGRSVEQLAVDYPVSQYRY